MKKMIVWGATGQAKVLRPIIEGEGYGIVALIDRNPRATSFIADVPLYHSLDEAPFKKGDHYYFVVAIGGDYGRDRIEIHERLAAMGFHAATLVHKTAFVEPSAQLGAGAQICPMAVVGVEAKIGVQAIINTNASVDHECVIGAGCHIMPGATLAGCVELGEACTIGSNATIFPRVKIGAGTVIGAGAVVTKDIPAGVVAFGAPAKVKRTLQERKQA